MSRYANELAHARLEALRALIDALGEAESPDEKRRCAVAILSAPDPCDIDDEIELVEDNEDEGKDEAENTEDDANEDAATEDSNAHASSDVQASSTVEESPQPKGVASTSHIQHRTSDTSPDIIANAIPPIQTDPFHPSRAGCYYTRAGLSIPAAG